jgi:NitT/TauT family transport system ATP-binding protein/nitrate/nitrite transport system substrate-binding protein
MSQQAKLRIGLLRLTDGAPVILAHEFGFFADEGLDVELTVEPSWANIADKLTFGLIDAAVIVPPLAFAVHLGLRGAAVPLIVPYAISAAGNTITLASGLAQQVRDEASKQKLDAAQALGSVLRANKTVLGIVHTYSTHNLLLRYWLATAGIEADRDVKLAVVPPARAVEALSNGEIAGFCAGAPWGEAAYRAGVGATIATSFDIWQNAPEKALALRAQWVQHHPEALAGALRALLRAAKFCDDAQNASYLSVLLGRPEYLDLDPEILLSGLPKQNPADGACRFWLNGTTFPWRSHGLWFLSEMQRWGLVGDQRDLRQIAEAVYRPDLYRATFTASGEAVPLLDWKAEGAHSSAWSLEAGEGPLDMLPDRFCDGKIFAPL